MSEQSPYDKLPFDASQQTPPEVTHDTFFVETFGQKRIAKAFLKVVLPPKTLPLLDVENLTVLPRHLSTGLFEGKVADVIYRVPIRRRRQHVDFFVILEHKSRNDALTIFQLWCYILRICEPNLRAAKKKKGFKRGKYRFPPVVPVIVYHGRTAFSGKTQLSDLFTHLPGVSRYLPRMRAILFDLSQIDDIPSDPEVPELKAVLTILRAVFRRGIGETAATVFRELKQTSPPEHVRLARLIWLYLVHSSTQLRRSYEELEPIAQRETGDEKMPTMVQIWRAEGRAEGVAQGEARALVRILKKRLNAMPQQVEDRVMAIRDLVVLESLTEFALTCQSLADFEEALR